MEDAGSPELGVYSDDEEGWAPNDEDIARLESPYRGLSEVPEEEEVVSLDASPAVSPKPAGDAESQGNVSDVNIASGLAQEDSVGGDEKDESENIDVKEDDVSEQEAEDTVENQGNVSADATASPNGLPQEDSVEGDKKDEDEKMDVEEQMSPKQDDTKEHENVESQRNVPCGTTASPAERLQEDLATDDGKDEKMDTAEQQLMRKDETKEHESNVNQIVGQADAGIEEEVQEHEAKKEDVEKEDVKKPDAAGQDEAKEHGIIGDKLAEQPDNDNKEDVQEQEAKEEDVKEQDAAEQDVAKEHESVDNNDAETPVTEAEDVQKKAAKEDNFNMEAVKKPDFGANNVNEKEVEEESVEKKDLKRPRVDDEDDYSIERTSEGPSCNGPPAEKKPAY